MTQLYATRTGDFFQVIRETKATIVVRPIRAEVVGMPTVRTGFDFDVELRAIVGDFTTVWYLDERQNTQGKRCRKREDGAIIVDANYGLWAWPSGGVETFGRNLG